MSRVAGFIFAAFVVFLLAGLIGLNWVGPEPAAAARSIARTVVRMAWMFGLWGALVAFMVFMITWVAEGWGEPSREVEPAEPASAAEPRASGIPGRDGAIAHGSTASNGQSYAVPSGYTLGGRGR